jgi:excinuclease ABC subunit C
MPDLKEITAGLPHSSGVYFFYNKHGKIIYIGKSKNLKNRVSSYFHKKNEDVSERTKEMIFSISDIKYKTYKTELEALLAEDELIKKHKTEYNIKQKEFFDYVYLSISNERYPALISVKDDSLSSEIFGPFRNKLFIEELRRMFCKVLGTAVCTNPNKESGCLEAEIGSCSAPCLERISTEEYSDKIQIIRNLLKGDADDVCGKANDLIKQFSADLQFEEAAEILKKKNFFIKFAERQKFINDFITKNLIVSAKDNFAFEKGIMIKSSKKKLTSDVFSKNKEKPKECLKYLDKALVVLFWINKSKSKYVFV